MKSAFVGILLSFHFLCGTRVQAEPSPVPSLPEVASPASSEAPEESYPPSSSGADSGATSPGVGFIYDPLGKRDPFTPEKELITTTTTTLVPAISLPSVNPEGASPLQLQEAKSFQVMAILWDTISPKAVLKDAKGQMHIVRRDIRIGTRQGYVAAIREREVVVAQPAVIDGKKSMETVILSFEKESGVK